MKKVALLSLIIPIVLVACQKSPEVSTQENQTVSGVNIQSGTITPFKEVYFSNDCIGLKVKKSFTEGELESGGIYFGKTDDISEITAISKFNEGFIHGISIHDGKKLENGVMAYIAKGSTYDDIPQPRYLVLHKENISVIVYILSDTPEKAYSIYADYLKNVESYGKNECKEIKTGEFVSHASIEKYIKDNMPEPAVKIDVKKPFKIDQYFKKGTYSIVKNKKKGSYTIITVDPTNKSSTNCLEMGGSFCVNFILKNNKLIYTNLAKIERYEDFSSIKEDIGEFYSITSSGAIFENKSGGGADCEGAEVSALTYIDLESGKKIYQDYTEGWECVNEGGKNKDESCDPKTCKMKKTKTKVFYDLPQSDSNRKKLDLKAISFEDAYLEYYKETKNNLSQVKSSDIFEICERSLSEEELKDPKNNFGNIAYKDKKYNKGYLIMHEPKKSGDSFAFSLEYYDFGENNNGHEQTEKIELHILDCKNKTDVVVDTIAGGPFKSAFVEGFTGKQIYYYEYIADSVGYSYGENYVFDLSTKKRSKVFSYIDYSLLDNAATEGSGPVVYNSSFTKAVKLQTENDVGAIWKIPGLKPKTPQYLLVTNMLTKKTEIIDEQADYMFVDGGIRKIVKWIDDSTLEILQKSGEKKRVSVR